MWTDQTPLFVSLSNQISCYVRPIGPLQDPVTWYGINYAGTQWRNGTFKTKESRAGLVRVPLFWSPTALLIYSVPCDRILQRAYPDVNPARRHTSDACVQILSGTEVGKNTGLRLVFSPTLLSCSTASCVLYNRKEHSHRKAASCSFNSCIIARVILHLATFCPVHRVTLTY